MTDQTDAEIVAYNPANSKLSGFSEEDVLLKITDPNDSTEDPIFEIGKIVKVLGVRNEQLPLQKETVYTVETTDWDEKTKVRKEITVVPVSDNKYLITDARYATVNLRPRAWLGETSGRQLKYWPKETKGGKRRRNKPTRKLKKRSKKTRRAYKRTV